MCTRYFVFVSNRLVYNLNPMPTFQVIHPMRMLDFIQKLYKSFKVLNKLSEKQSNDFQREVVTLLVDAKQNVDQQTYNSIVIDGNIQAFVLQMLGKTICRNPFKNQFELNKNLATIAQNLKKEQEELQKKQKVLERREEKIKGIQDGIITTLKQKLQSMENQAMQRLIKKEGDIKKSIVVLTGQLKTKEKVILQKYEETKSNMKMLASLQQKQKAVNEKIKVLERKEKQFKSKGNQAENFKKESQLIQYRENNEKLKESLKQATKRYKNLELAYKRLKNIKPQTETTPKALQKQQQSAKEQKEQFDLQHLQLSQIQSNEKNNDCEQLINYIDFEQATGKLQSIKKIFNKSEPKSSVTQIQQIKELLEIRRPEEKALVQVPSFSSEEEESQQEEMPACLQKIEKEEQRPQSFIQQIRNIPLQEDKQKQQFIISNQLFQLIDTCYKLNTPFQTCQVLLQKILELIEESPHYLKIITYLSSPKVISFLQHIYLSHQTNADIVQTTTLIISRIKLKDHKLNLSSSFIKALQIRMKVENKNSFLFGNINFILSQ